MSSNAQPQSIPTRRVQLNHLSELPHDYGTTPGGTMFSTTPGGTRIIYDRKFLLQCRDSPLSRTPPSNLPSIPGVTTPDKSPKRTEPLARVPEHNNTKVQLSPEEINFHSMPEFGYGPWPVYPQLQSFDAGPFISPPPPLPATSQLGLYRQRQQQHSPVSPVFPFPNFGGECLPPPFIPPHLPPQPMFHEHSNMMGTPPPADSDSQLAIWRHTKAEQYYTMAEQLRNRSKSYEEAFMHDQNSNCVVYPGTDDPSIIACQRSFKHEIENQALTPSN